MRKIRKSNVRLTDMPEEWYSRSEDVLDTSIAGSYMYTQNHSNDGAGYKAGLIAGVVVGAFLGAFVLALLYIRRRQDSHVRNWRFPRINRNTRFGLDKLRRRKSYGIKEMISISATTEFSALQQEQQQLSPVHAYCSNNKSTRSFIIRDVDMLPDLKLRAELPQQDSLESQESSWLSLTPDRFTVQNDVEKADRPGTARTSRVTIPSYYYHYYRKYFDRDSYHVQSQYHPESRFSSSDLISYGDRSSRASIYQKRATSTHHERITLPSKPLVPDKSFTDEFDNEKEFSKPPIDQDLNLAYFQFDTHYPHEPKPARLRPRPPLLPATRRSRRSMDTYRSSQQYHRSRKTKENRQTMSSIATVSTAPIFRQHPGEKVDLEFMGRLPLVRSSVLSGLTVR